MVMTPPIRSEIFSFDRFGEHGRSLGMENLGSADLNNSARTVFFQRKTIFFPRLVSNMRALRVTNAALVTQTQAGFDLSPAGEWLLDNFHLIDAQLKEVQTGLPRRYYKSLPVLTNPPLSGLPRIYSVAWAFVAHTDSVFDAHLLTHFLQSYQTTCPLSLAELWALPTTLRVVLIENLRRLAERCVALDVSQETEDNHSVRHAILSLRAVNEANWQQIVAQSSALTRQMLGSAVFAAEDAKTQASSLYAIEQRARSTGQSAQQVATDLLASMQVACTQSSAGKSMAVTGSAPGYWLQDKDRMARWRSYWRLPVYGLVALMGTLALTAYTVPFEPHDWRYWLCSLWVLLPASEAVLAVMNRLISECIQPQHLPRLALDDGIPALHRVLVVMPCMLTQEAEIKALAHRLYLHHLANPEAQAQFALLTDWIDAETLHSAADEPLLTCALEAVRALNDKLLETSHTHPGATDWPRFVLLHRRRSFSLTEQRWMGWERKRGKLAQLIHQLANSGVAPMEGEPQHVFMDLGRFSQLATHVRYVLTLDSDTQLPPGRLRALVGVAAHPLNQPVLSNDGSSVVSGYGILQPRILLPLAEVGQDTYFRWLFAGQCGMDTYNAVTSEVYQDLFAEGTFSGKGLLHVAAMDAVLGGERSLKTDAVLSHDLIEGALARCAVVSDITLLEDAPVHPDAASRRLHRWVRGDWQLLPFVGLRHLSALNRWKLLDNLRRSLVPVASLVLILLAMQQQWLSMGAALGVVIAAYLAGPLLGAIAALIPSRQDISFLHFFKTGVQGTGRTLLGSAWHLAMLPEQAFLAADAVVRTSYRLLVSRRHLLQWTTAASAQSSVRTGFWGLAKQHAPIGLMGLAVMPWSMGLGLLWLCNPLLIYGTSLARRRDKGRGLLSHEREYLTHIARDTWTLFERTVTAQERHLPPDNLQTWPHEQIAHRTSPTNIGLYLLSSCCARAFGWIDTSNLLHRLEATQATLVTLQRHQGHFLNWYDTQTGSPLMPQYVSTVDSGNLSGCLLAVSACCYELSQEITQKVGQQDEPLLDAERARLILLARSLAQLAWEPSYAFLYDENRHLLHIGYRLAEQQLDANFYDLLSSESRLTSLLAIAKGDVPAKHWVALGRPLYAQGTHVGMRSWSGSMFEYLMPSLLLDEPRGSVLQASCQQALREQVDFARKRGIPWGMSESAYAQTDDTQAYQYGPQGTPRLALRRTPPSECVVAPYATALAAQIAPRLAIANFKQLESLAARTTLGFIEALDFSAASCERVQTYMAHHQGMTIAALANVLLQGAPRRWGMSNPHIEAVSSILHEGLPRDITSRYTPAAPHTVPAIFKLGCHWTQATLPSTAAPELTHILSNGRYSTLLRPNGAGYSRLGQVAISRWRDDALRDAHGHFFYLRRGTHDVTSVPGLSSLTQHPAPQEGATYRTVFHADSACFDAEWADVHTRIKVWVSPQDDIEFRQVEIFNLTDQPLNLTLFSVVEVSLSSLQADEAHPAFANLFLRASHCAHQQAMLWSRTPRVQGEKAVYCAHFLIQTEVEKLPDGAVQFQCDRALWQGRCRPVSQPLADFLGDLDGEQVVTGLDPICAMSVSFFLAQHGKTVLTFATAASTGEGVDTGVNAREQELARWTALITQYQLPDALPPIGTTPHLGHKAHPIPAETLVATQAMTSALVFSLTRNERSILPPVLVDKRLLWRWDISGDLPVIVVSIAAVQGLRLVRAMLQAMRWWSWCQVPCDVVVLNTEPASYWMPLHHELAALLDNYNMDPAKTARLTVLQASNLSQAEQQSLHAFARLYFVADGRTLAWHVGRWVEELTLAHPHSYAVAQSTHYVPASNAKSADCFRGQFTSHDFSFQIEGASRPAKPWINVLANPDFGAQISDSGAGYSWAINSRLNQITPWSNDPVLDTPAEWFVLQDKRSHALWSLTPLHPFDVTRYHVVHGIGYSSFAHSMDGLVVNATWCVDTKLSVKQVQVRIHNTGKRERDVRLVGVVEWLLGANRVDRMTVHTSRDEHLHGLYATQCDSSAGFGGGTAFWALQGDPKDAWDWTCDRRELFDVQGRLVVPNAFKKQSGSGLDPCAALSSSFLLAPNETRKSVFLLGYAPDTEGAQKLLHQATCTQSSARQQAVQTHWDSLLGGTVVTTPDPLFDAMVNRWLLYQTVSCRLWAKAGFYQAGGAFGFRDQLQDCLALSWAAPDMLRAQIVRCASRQYAAGDVQHWWHEPTGAGLRTQSSDDLLWLPYACLHYVQTTGRVDVWDEMVGFIEGAQIPDGQVDVYDTPQISPDQASMFEHCARALDRSLEVGQHGLPLMRGGDWNDGMNCVGTDGNGQGESVWLGWMLSRLVADLLPLAASRGQAERVQRWGSAMQIWQQAWVSAGQDGAWDGEWFKRGFFGNGQALGSSANAECHIDSVAQSWAVLSNMAPLNRQRQAMASLHTHLVDDELGLMKLLSPAFTHSQPSPGYIQAYPAGVRENGGQYTHAAVWALMAQAQLSQYPAGDIQDFDKLSPNGIELCKTPLEQDLVYRYFTYLSPAHRAAHPLQGKLYGLEPYAVAGDVCTQAPYAGRGGWSWYTGSAAWLHRAAIESILGLKQSAQTLSFSPCLPSHWARAEITLKRSGLSFHFILIRLDEWVNPHIAADTAQENQAQVLRPHQLLNWFDLRQSTTFLIPLIPL
jgi:cyclic beta-1,2-glucan synthetase